MRHLVCALLLLFTPAATHAITAQDAGGRVNAIGAAADSASAPVAPAGDVVIALDNKSFAPDRGEAVSLIVYPRHSDAVYTTARVYTLSGRLVVELFRDKPRTAADTRSPDRWNGRDRHGRIVDGGVYVINVSWGASPGAVSSRENVSVAVIR